MLCLGAMHCHTRHQTPPQAAPCTAHYSPPNLLQPFDETALRKHFSSHLRTCRMRSKFMIRLFFGRNPTLNLFSHREVRHSAFLSHRSQAHYRDSRQNLNHSLIRFEHHQTSSTSAHGLLRTYNIIASITPPTLNRSVERVRHRALVQWAISDGLLHFWQSCL
jgi:hypothetical protein